MSGREEAPPGTPGAGERVTAVAPANIAFVKYWGAHDVDAGVPRNRTVSMTLRRCVSRCTVAAAGSPGRDEVLRATGDGELVPAPEGFAAPIRAHLGRLRRRAGREVSLRVATRNNFPASAGLASSASGFAALTLAVTRLLGLEDGPASLSRLARLSGSGSAARSTLGGYVEWPARNPGRDGRSGTEDGAPPPETEMRGPARQLAPPGHWDLRDVIAIVDTRPKAVPSREGHRRAPTSPHYATRLEEVARRLQAVRSAIRGRDLEALGPVLEEEAVELHLIAMSSRPPIFYWSPGTLEVVRAVRAMRDEGTPAFFTIDAGPNVHVLCRPDAEPDVAERLEPIPAVERVIRDGVGAGARLDDRHLL